VARASRMKHRSTAYSSYYDLNNLGKWFGVVGPNILTTMHMHMHCVGEHKRALLRESYGWWYSENHLHLSSQDMDGLSLCR